MRHKGCLSGLVFLSAWPSPKVLLQIWVEAVAAEFIFTDLAMHVVHKWMHKRAYPLHKKHHKGKADVMCLRTPDFDLLDFFLSLDQECLPSFCAKVSLGLVPTFTSWVTT